MADEGNESGGERQFRTSRQVDEAITDIAARRFGVITTAQLTAAGLSSDQIKRRVAAGRLRRVYRSIYSAWPLSAEGYWLAAVLFAAPGAFLSHGPASAALQLRSAQRGPVDVTVPRRIRSPPGIRAHRALVPPDERWVHQGIPLTCPARTVLDLAASLKTREVERMIRQVHAKRLPIRPSLATLIDRYPGRRGMGTFRAAVAAFDEAPGWTESEFEDRFLDFLDRHGFPRPLTNAPVQTHLGTFRVDCLWPDQRLIVELDGFSAHGTRLSFRDDRRRDRAFRLAGYHPSRFVWDDLDDEPSLAVEIRGLLGA